MTGVTVLLTDEGAGVKLYADNLYSPCRFIPEDAWVDPQVEGDVPPYSQGEGYLPSPI